MHTMYVNIVYKKSSYLKRLNNQYILIMYKIKKKEIKLFDESKIELIE